MHAAANDTMNEVKNNTSRSVTVWMFVVFALPFIIFGQTISFNFINYGDNVYVYDNPMVLHGVSLESVRWAFTTAHFGNYHPLTWMSHMLDAQWFGPTPGRHHGVNVLFHAMNGVLLFLLLRGWTGAVGKSAAVALLFAVHPLHAESVAWVSQRKEVLSTFLLLLTLGVYTQYVRRPSRRDYGALLLLFVLALLAKPTLIVLPALLLLLDYWPLNRFSAERGTWANIRPLLVEKVPLFAVAAAMAIVTYVALKQNGTTLSGSSYSAAARVANAIITYAVYLGQTIWPAKLVPFYPHAGIDAPWPNAGVAFAVVAIVTAIAIRYRASHPFLAVGWCWYLVSLLPNIGIVYPALYGHADRYTYVPLIGVFIIAVWGAPAIAARWSLSQRTITGFAAAAVGLFALMAYVQTGHWRNSESLWRYTIKVAPKNMLAYQNLGALYLRNGNLEESEAALLQALEHSAANPYARVVIGGRSLNSLGAVATARSDFDQASEYYARAVELFPRDARVRTNLGEALLAAVRLDEAELALRRAVELDAQLARAWNSLALTLVLQRKMDEALDAGAHAVALEPGNPEFRYHMALAEFAAERYDRALKHLDEIFALDEEFEPALVLRTEILARRGIVAIDSGELDAP